MRSGDLQGKYFHSKFSIDFEQLVYSRPINSLEMFAIIVYQKFCGKFFKRKRNSNSVIMKVFSMPQYWEITQ